jgi:molybdate transport system substrate-binding protein
MGSKPIRSAVIVTVVMGCAAVLGERSAAAAEIKLIASPGVRAVVNELAPQFEKATGHRVARDFAVIAVLKRRIDAGEAFDVVIPSPEVIDELVGQGKIAPDARAPFGRTGVALGVRKGAPKPDISTPESLKRALLEAKAVGHSKEGQSGVHFVEALKRLGILDEMRPKLRPLSDGEQAAAMQKGELDIAASGMGVIMEMPGVDLLGGLPPQVQGYVRFAIGVSTASKEPEAARALVRFLTSPEAASTFKAKGMERERVD